MIYQNSNSNTANRFADDSKLYTEIIDELDCDRLQKDLNLLSAWSKQWLLNFNSSKCVVLKLRQSIEYVYSLNSIHLGMIIQSNMKPEAHVNEISKKAYQRVGMIKRCFSNLTQKKVPVLYKTTVRPILEYASVIWQPYYQKDIDKLQKVQDKCLSLCGNPPKMDSLLERWKIPIYLKHTKYCMGNIKLLQTVF